MILYNPVEDLNRHLGGSGANLALVRVVRFLACKGEMTHEDVLELAKQARQACMKCGAHLGMLTYGAGPSGAICVDCTYAMPSTFIEFVPRSRAAAEACLAQPPELVPPRKLFEREDAYPLDRRPTRGSRRAVVAVAAGVLALLALIAGLGAILCSCAPAAPGCPSGSCDGRSGR